MGKNMNFNNNLEKKTMIFTKIFLRSRIHIFWGKAKAKNLKGLKLNTRSKSRRQQEINVFDNM